MTERYQTTLIINKTTCTYTQCLFVGTTSKNNKEGESPWTLFGDYLSLIMLEFIWGNGERSLINLSGVYPKWRPLPL